MAIRSVITLKNNDGTPKTGATVQVYEYDSLAQDYKGNLIGQATEIPNKGQYYLQMSEEKVVTIFVNNIREESLTGVVLEGQEIDAATRIKDGTISINKFTQAARDEIRSGGNITNNPDDVTLRTNASSQIELHPDYKNKIDGDGASANPIDKVGMYAHLKNNNVINVKDFGAKGDGSVYENMAFQNAIDYIVENGGTLFIPAGLYKFNGNLTISGLDGINNIRIIGQGKHNTSLWYYAPDNQPFFDIDMKDISSGDERTINIKSIGITLKSGTGGDAIFLKNSARSILSDLYIYGFTNGAGVHIDGDDGVSGDFNRIEKSYIGYCKYGIWFDLSATTSGSYMDANMVANCQLIQNTVYDLRLSNTGNVYNGCNAHFISDSWIQASAATGISIEDNVEACKFNNISIDGDGSSNVLHIESTCGDNLFNNITIDGNINDQSMKAKFINLRSLNEDAAIIINEHSWEKNLIKLGIYYLWVDGSGNLRIKNNKPTSDTDGTIVGTQA